MDERAEALQREQAIREANQTPKEIGGIAPVAAATTKQETNSEVSPQAETKEDIMVPKWRFDEVNREYQKLRNAPQTEAPAPQAPPSIDVEKLVDAKIAPLKVQLEVDQVLKAHPDFSEFAPQVMTRIKNKPTLTLEEAYQLEKFSHLESKAKEEGKEEAYQTIEKKASLQVERPGVRKPAPSVDELVRDKSVPLSEIARMLPHE